MARDILYNYPDYLRDFEDICAISQSLEKMITKSFNQAEIMYKKRWFRLANCDRWENVIEDNCALNVRDTGKILHMMHDVVTIEEMTEYIGAWLIPGNYKVEFDCENYCVNIKTKLAESFVNKRKRSIRNLIPLNMEINFEYVSAL